MVVKTAAAVQLLQSKCVSLDTVSGDGALIAPAGAGVVVPMLFAVTKPHTLNAGSGRMSDGLPSKRTENAKALSGRNAKRAGTSASDAVKFLKVPIDEAFLTLLDQRRSPGATQNSFVNDLLFNAATGRPGAFLPPPSYLLQSPNRVRTLALRLPKPTVAALGRVRPRGWTSLRWVAAILQFNLE
jgi:hypothetical protein